VEVTKLRMVLALFGRTFFGGSGKGQWDPTKVIIRA
jgi:hypothetical protein